MNRARTTPAEEGPRARVAYDEKAIQTLDALSHIRLRTGMYIGRIGDGTPTVRCGGGRAAELRDVEASRGESVRADSARLARLPSGTGPGEGRPPALPSRLSADPGGRSRLPPATVAGGGVACPSPSGGLTGDPYRKAGARKGKGSL